MSNEITKTVDEYDFCFTANSSVVGSSHENGNNSKPCEDVSRSYSDNDIGIIVVCDGAGSSKYAKESATITAAATIEYFLNKKYEEDEDIRVNIAKLVVPKLLDLIEGKECKYPDNGEHFFSTLIFAVFYKDLNKYVLGHIGDGAIVGLYPTHMKTLSFPYNDSNGYTLFFLAIAYDNKEYTKHFRIKRGEINNLIGLAVMTDGVSGDTDRGNYMFLDDIYEKSNIKIHPNLLNNFEKIEDFSKDCSLLDKELEETVKINTHDDCSLALMKLIKPKQEINITYEQLSNKFERIKLEQQITRLNASANNSQIILDELSKNIALICDKFKSIQDKYKDSDRKYNECYKSIKKINGLLNISNIESDKLKEDIDKLRNKASDMGFRLLDKIDKIISIIEKGNKKILALKNQTNDLSDQIIADRRDLSDQLKALVEEMKRRYNTVEGMDKEIKIIRKKMDDYITHTNKVHKTIGGLLLLLLLLVVLI